MVASGGGSESLLVFVDTRSQTLYCWIDFTISCNTPFSFVENYSVFKPLLGKVNALMCKLRCPNAAAKLRIADYLGADAAIVHISEFEAACVSVLLGEREALPVGRRRLLRQFESPGTVVAESITSMIFAERSLKRRKEERQSRTSYPPLPSSPATSNCVEKFFSQAKHLLSHHCTRMLPLHLQMLFFLKANKRFWSAKTESDL
ncbi:hypothetical protein GN244_ATG02213 [Phytophthora infestans]|uniref:HAT C-terminal dimerisation domain-containing protein n=1 Tax=Phytophthora infestans TaxID=4787 RepID=A0A833WLS7_PHYIN|nr:hypothetical protein GN244_ATG02213 [Phytophthora infestans]